MSLMCHGDMTLIPVEWSVNRGWIMPAFDTVYTCRDYNSLKQWTKDRDGADPAVYPKNAERLRAKYGIEWPEVAREAASNNGKSRGG